MATQPVRYNPQILDEICAWIAEGKTLREFCRKEGKPSYAAVYDWQERDQEFATRFARAREIGEDVIAQECIEIADNGANDWMETKFGPQVNQEHIQRSRLRVDARLKLLAKWNPKKYGERIDHNVSGTIEIAPALDKARKRITAATIEQRAQLTAESETPAESASEGGSEVSGAEG
jgi:hypothetical protein